MSHRINRDLYKALESSALIQKVATGGTISVGGIQLGVIRDFGAGTFKVPTLDNDTGRGCMLILLADGAQIWQNASSSTLLTLGSGEVGILISIGETSPYWKGINTAGLSDDFDTLLSLSGPTIGAAANGVENTETNEDTIGGAVVELQQYAILIPGVGYATSSAASPVTPTGAAFAGAHHKYWENTTDGAVALTTPTAAQILAAFSGVEYNAAFPFAFKVTVVNRGNNTITITGGSNVTIGGENTVATLTTRTYVIVFTSATACTMTSVDKGTIET